MLLVGGSESTVSGPLARFLSEDEGKYGQKSLDNCRV